MMVSALKPKNRITNEPIDAADPGTPDDQIGNRRLLGRLAYRRAPEHEPTGQQDTEFWLGWYDERLRAIYGRN